MKDLQEQVNAYRKQSEDYQQRLETEQKFIELYKLEIEARERDSAERDKRLQSIPQLEWVFFFLIFGILFKFWV
jgi:hypothetical protein